MGIRIKGVHDTSKQNKLITILFAFMSVIIPVMVLVDVFNLPCNMKVIAAFTLLEVLVISVGVANQRITKYVLICAFATLLAVVYFNRYELRSAVLESVNLIIEKINFYFDKDINTFVTGEFNKKSAVTLLIIVVNMELALTVVTLIWYKIHALFLMIFTSIPLIMGLAVGVMPGRKIMLLYTALMLSFLSLMPPKHLRSKKGKIYIDSKRSMDVVVCIMTIALVCNVIATNTVSPVNYNREESIQKTRDYIENKLDKLSNWNWITLFNKKNIASGGVSGGKLGEADELKLGNDSAFEIDVPSDSGSIYIKAYIGVNYKGDHWEGLSQEQRDFVGLKAIMSNGWINYDRMNRGYNMLVDSILYMDNIESSEGKANLESFEKKLYDTISFKLTGASRDYFYYPYFADLSMYSVDNDLAVNNIMPNECSYNFINYKCDGIYSDSTLEWEFDDGIHNDYLIWNELYSGLTEDTITKEVKDYFDHELKMYKMWSAGIEEQIKFVKDTLSKRCTYSLKPGCLKDGEDLLTEFLINDRKGYCSYYATAATIMFRQMGVPARYVEGYLVSNKDYLKNVISKENRKQIINREGDIGEVPYSKIDVKSGNAHAWTEIYSAYYGWIPVEVTPGYSSDIDKSYVKEPETTTKNVQQTSGTTKTTEKTSTTKSKTTGKNNKAQKSENVDWSNVIKIAVILFGCMLAGTVAVGIITESRKKRIAKLNQKNHRRSTIYMSKLLDRICQKSKCAISNDMTITDKADKLSNHFETDYDETLSALKTIEKAVFSKEDTIIQEEERNILYKLMENIVDNRRKTGGYTEKLFLLLNFPGTTKK